MRIARVSRLLTFEEADIRWIEKMASATISFGSVWEWLARDSLDVA
jgi:hypothetical protein